MQRSLAISVRFLGLLDLERCSRDVGTPKCQGVLPGFFGYFPIFSLSAHPFGSLLPSS